MKKRQEKRNAAAVVVDAVVVQAPFLKPRHQRPLLTRVGASLCLMLSGVSLSLCKYGSCPLSGGCSIGSRIDSIIASTTMNNSPVSISVNDLVPFERGDIPIIPIIENGTLDDIPAIGSRITPLVAVCVCAEFSFDDGDGGGVCREDFSFAGLGIGFYVYTSELCYRDD